MTTPPIIELTTRARDVFRLVVDAYLDTGQPVGSRTLSKLTALNLSPASIRNVMQDLEELGLRSEEHTSELQSLMRISYAVFCLKKKKKKISQLNTTEQLNNIKKANPNVPNMLQQKPY